MIIDLGPWLILWLRLVKSRTFMLLLNALHLYLIDFKALTWKVLTWAIIKQLKNPDEDGYFKEWDGVVKINRWGSKRIATFPLPCPSHYPTPWFPELTMVTFPLSHPSDGSRCTEVPRLSAYMDHLSVNSNYSNSWLVLGWQARWRSSAAVPVGETDIVDWCWYDSYPN